MALAGARPPFTTNRPEPFTSFTINTTGQETAMPNLPRLHTDETNERFCQIAREAGLNPDLIPEADWKIDGDTITYKYVLLEADGNTRYEGGMPLKTMWMTAKVGSGKRAAAALAVAGQLSEARASELVDDAVRAFSLSEEPK